jgi:hypothetical protein
LHQVRINLCRQHQVRINQVVAHQEIDKIQAAVVARRTRAGKSASRLSQLIGSRNLTATQPGAQ